MQAMLTFNLEDHEDRRSHMRAIKSLDMILCISDHLENLRQDYKHGTEDKHADFWRSDLLSIMDDRGIDLDELLS